MKYVLRLLNLFVLSVFGIAACSSQPGDVQARSKEDISATTASGAYDWRPVRIGGGGFLSGQSWDKAGQTHVVRADVQGAYIWSDERDQWVPLVTQASMPADEIGQASMAEGVYEVVVAPSDPDRIYMALKGAVYRSTDRGQHFERAWAKDAPLAFHPNGEFRFFGPFIAVHPTRPDLLLFGTPEDGLWRSADGGRSWTHVDSVPTPANLKPQKKDGSGAPGIVVMFDPAGKQIWASSAGHGLFVSSDEGRHFRPLTPASEPGPKQMQHGVFTGDGAFLATDPVTKTVWRYRSGKWEDIGTRIGEKPRRYASIARNPSDGALFLFDLNGRGYRSTDDGDSWRPLMRRVAAGDKDPPWLGVINYDDFFGVSSVGFDPRVPGRLWATSGTGAFYADLPMMEYWLSWVSQTRGIEELVSNDVIVPPGGPALFAAWDFGIHVKPDPDRYSTSFEPGARSLISAQQMDWSAGNPRFIVTNASDARIGCCTQDGKSVLAGYSEDGGVSWTRFPTLPKPPGTKPDDPWAMSFGTIAVSADDPDNIIWEPTFNRSPFYTLDRGKSWNRVVLPGEVLPNTGSHTALHLNRRTLVADRMIGSRFYLMHSGEWANRALQGLWRTEDRGQHWTMVYKGEIAPGSAGAVKMRAVPGKAGHLFFTSGLISNGDTFLRRSVDGGANWTVLNRISQVDDIAFGKAAAGSGYPALYLSGKVDGEYGIWRSLDDAGHWQRIADFPMGRLDRVTTMAADMEKFGRLYIGFMGSSWIYGDVSECKPVPFTSDAGSDCRSILSQ